jgi:hypothetical protein
MGYDPNEGAFTPLQDVADVEKFIKNVPHGIFVTTGETVTVKGCEFYVHEVGESRLILKPKREPK